MVNRLSLLESKKAENFMSLEPTSEKRRRGLDGLLVELIHAVRQARMFQTRALVDRSPPSPRAPPSGLAPGSTVTFS